MHLSLVTRQTVEPYSIGILGSDQDDEHSPYQGPTNRLVVIRRNEVLNNGGIVVRGHTTDVLVEGNQIHNSSVGVAVNRTEASHVLLRNNLWSEGP